MLKSEDSLFVMIDVQGKLADAMHNASELFEQIQRLARSANTLKIPILITEQLPDKLGSTRNELSDALGNAPIISKSSFSCCGETAFIDTLKAFNKKQIIVSGIEAHICILQTVLELMEKGYEVFVAADAISSRNPQNKELAIRRMRQHGAEILPTESVMFEWLRDASHPAFREVRKYLA